MWQKYRIFVLFLPARAPEWNPIEKLWNCLEERLKNYEIETIKNKKDRVVIAALKILSEISHYEVYKFFKSCGVFEVHGYADQLQRQ